MIKQISLLTILSFSILSLTLVPNVYANETIQAYACGYDYVGFYTMNVTTGDYTNFDYWDVQGVATGGAGGSVREWVDPAYHCLWMTTDPTTGINYMIGEDNDGWRFLMKGDPTTNIVNPIGWLGQLVFDVDYPYSNMIFFDNDGQLYTGIGQASLKNQNGIYAVDKTTGIVDATPTCTVSDPLIDDDFHYMTLNYDDDEVYLLSDATNDQFVKADLTSPDCISADPLIETSGSTTVLPVPYGYIHGFSYDTVLEVFYVIGDYTTDHEWRYLDIFGVDTLINEFSNLDTVRGLGFTITVDPQPVITLTGSDPQNVVVNESYTELGATCLDPIDGSLSVVIDSSAVNTSVIGTYEVIYECTDLFPQTVQEIRTVEVSAVPNVELWHVDVICLDSQLFDFSSILDFLEICPIDGVGEEPEITITGDPIIQIAVGDTYTELGAIAIDTDDGDITGSIIATSDVDTSVVGVYFVTYDVQDSQGNDAVQQIRTIVVASAGSSSSGSGGSQSGGTVSNSQGGIGDGSGSGSGTPDLDDLSDEQIDDLLEQLAPTQGTTIIEEIFQTFFEFRVLDKSHDNIVVNSFLSDQSLGLQWTSGDDIIVSGVTSASSPFDFTFEAVPNIKTGSGSAISENSLTYNLDVPDTICSVEFGFDCVEKIRYSVPITVNAIINGTDVEATGIVLVDLTEDQINPLILILMGTVAIPIVAGFIHHARGGSNPSRVKDLLH